MCPICVTFIILNSSFLKKKFDFFLFAWLNKIIQKFGYILLDFSFEAFLFWFSVSSLCKSCFLTIFSVWHTSKKMSICFWKITINNVYFWTPFSCLMHSQEFTSEKVLLVSLLWFVLIFYVKDGSTQKWFEMHSRLRSRSWL